MFIDKIKEKLKIDPKKFKMPSFQKLKIKDFSSIKLKLSSFFAGIRGNGIGHSKKKKVILMLILLFVFSVILIKKYNYDFGNLKTIATKQTDKIQNILPFGKEVNNQQKDKNIINKNTIEKQPNIANFSSEEKIEKETSESFSVSNESVKTQKQNTQQNRQTQANKPQKLYLSENEKQLSDSSNYILEKRVDEIVSSVLAARKKAIDAENSLVSLSDYKYRILKTILEATPELINNDPLLRRNIILSTVQKELGISVNEEILAQMYNNNNNAQQQFDSTANINIPPDLDNIIKVPNIKDINSESNKMDGNSDSSDNFNFNTNNKKTFGTGYPEEQAYNFRNRTNTNTISKEELIRQKKELEKQKQRLTIESNIKNIKIISINTIGNNMFAEILYLNNYLSVQKGDTIDHHINVASISFDGITFSYKIDGTTEHQFVGYNNTTKNVKKTSENLFYKR